MTTPQPPRIHLKALTPLSPLTWLVLGWQDFRRAPLIGLVHGGMITGFALLLLLFANQYFWLLAGAFSGFLLVAPVLAVGLYAVSRALEHHKPARFMLVWRTWMSWRGKPRHDWRLVTFGLLLGLAGTGWVLTSAALITVFSPEPINRPWDFLMYVVISRDHFLFEAWLALGGILSAPVFASSVMTLPLLMDRRVGVLDAVLASWRVVVTYPVPMAIWAGLILLLSLLSIVTAMLGFLLVVPILGHGTWHAYRAALDAHEVPMRLRGAAR